MDKLLEKLAGVLSKEDLDTFKADVERTISEKVEAEVTKASLLTESQNKDKVAQLVSEEKAKLIDENKKQMVELENHIVEQVDVCLERLIDEDFKDDVVKSFAVNEALLPIVNGIKDLFTKHVRLDESAQSQIDEVTKKYESTKSELSETIGAKMKVEDELLALKKQVFISDKISSLSESQKAAVTSIFADKDFDFVEKNIDNFVKAISEAKKEDDEDEDEKDEKDEKGEKSKKGKEVEVEGKKPLMAENTDPTHDPKIVAESKKEAVTNPEKDLFASLRGLI